MDKCHKCDSKKKQKLKKYKNKSVERIYSGYPKGMDLVAY